MWTDIHEDSRKSQERDRGQVETGGGVGGGGARAEMRPEPLQHTSVGSVWAGAGGRGVQEVSAGKMGRTEVLNNENQIQFPKRHFRGKKKRHK